MDRLRRRRVAMLVTATTVVALGISARLYELQVLQRDGLRERADRQHKVTGRHRGTDLVARSEHALGKVALKSQPSPRLVAPLVLEPSVRVRNLDPVQPFDEVHALRRRVRRPLRGRNERNQCD